MSFAVYQLSFLNTIKRNHTKHYTYFLVKRINELNVHFSKNILRCKRNKSYIFGKESGIYVVFGRDTVKSFTTMLRIIMKQTLKTPTVENYCQKTGAYNKKCRYNFNYLFSKLSQRPRVLKIIKLNVSKKELVDLMKINLAVQ